ncbi:MAG TPA: 23S rRNA (adenine(2503)-C(2))-methyltransferase RlmN, partial [Candidatus Omnitrophota bacterium]|nr:23S rRNA (adenine(2503)-C(2))-methyltransferase RlmN [Candidatus Omnitrophota bacterium]
MKNIIGFLPKEFEEEMIEAGEKAYRARQIISWIYKKRAFDFQLMTDLPQTLIKKLAKHFEVTDLLLEQTVVSRTDGAEKFLWKLSDENLIESVLIRAKERNTICVSTQVGCKTRCLFCESGKNGFKRDLTDGEIVGQIMGTIRETKCDINNVVFMGMGEPLDNYKNL